MKKWNQAEIYILLNCRYFAPLKFIMVRGLRFFYVYEKFGSAEMLKVQIMCKNIRNVQNIVLFTIHGAENNLCNFNFFITFVKIRIYINFCSLRTRDSKRC